MPYTPVRPERQPPALLTTDDRPLCVVSVTYNSAEVIVGLLDSLPSGLAGVEHHEVVVVDNASSDGSAEIAEAHSVRPRVIRTGRNGGYAAGINAALATISSEVDVLILNPDVRLSPGAGRPLVDRLKVEGVGVAVPRTLRDDGHMLKSLRREPSILTAWSEAILGGRLSALLDLGEIVNDAGRYRDAGVADWASGGILAIAARARKRAGAWDESYFLYSEEVDFQRQVRAGGFKISYVANSEMVHIGGEYRVKPSLYGMLTANRVRYYSRYHNGVAAAVFRLGIVCGEALRSARGSPTHRAGLLAAVKA